jgi:hypothetical protein
MGFRRSPSQVPSKVEASLNRVRRVLPLLFLRVSPLRRPLLSEAVGVLILGVVLLRADVSALDEVLYGSWWVCLCVSRSLGTGCEEEEEGKVGRCVGCKTLVPCEES